VPKSSAVPFLVAASQPFPPLRGSFTSRRRRRFVDRAPRGGGSAGREVPLIPRLEEQIFRKKKVDDLGISGASGRVTGRLRTSRRSVNSLHPSGSQYCSRRGQVWMPLRRPIASRFSRDCGTGAEALRSFGVVRATLRGRLEAAELESEQRATKRRLQLRGWKPRRGAAFRPLMQI
jgi:hypothetical protein